LLDDLIQFHVAETDILRCFDFEQIIFAITSMVICIIVSWRIIMQLEEIKKRSNYLIILLLSMGYPEFTFLDLLHAV